MDTWEKLDIGLVMTVLGMGIVFLVLIFLSSLLGFFERLFGTRRAPSAPAVEERKPEPTAAPGEKPPPPAPSLKPAPPPAPAAPAPSPVRPAVVAAVMAAVSAYLQAEAMALEPPLRRLPDDLSFWGRAARLEQMMARRI